MIPKLEELLVILVIIIVLFGGKKLPGLARGIGESVREVRKGFSGITDDVKKTDDTSKTDTAKSDKSS